MLSYSVFLLRLWSNSTHTWILECLCQLRRTGYMIYDSCHLPWQWLDVQTVRSLRGGGMCFYLKWLYRGLWQAVDPNSFNAHFDKLNYLSMIFPSSCKQTNKYGFSSKRHPVHIPRITSQSIVVVLHAHAALCQVDEMEALAADAKQVVADYQAQKKAMQ